MKTKQQAIQEAYIKLLGEKMYNENKSVINFNDGTIKLKVGLKLPNNGVGFHFITTFSDYSIVIANDLIGIENNNGWIKIDENFEWGKYNDYLIFFNSITNESVVSLKFSLCAHQSSDYKERFTHYQPIEKPKPPHH